MQLPSYDAWIEEISRQEATKKELGYGLIGALMTAQVVMWFLQTEAVIVQQCQRWTLNFNLIKNLKPNPQHEKNTNTICDLPHTRIIKNSRINTGINSKSFGLNRLVVFLRMS